MSKAPGMTVLRDQHHDGPRLHFTEDRQLLCP